MARYLLSALPLLVVLITVAVAAQSTGTGRPLAGLRVDRLPEERIGFTFCRLRYTSNRREPGGSGWTTDYPLADQNLMIRLAEFTQTRITRHPDGSPHHAVMTATDPSIFLCPFLFTSDVGTMQLRPSEIESLRNYLLKGGFLWVDDFWGRRALTQWSQEIGRVLPDFDIVELPMNHPIYSTFYSVQSVPQIPSIQFWRGSGGATSERGAESARPSIRGIFDGAGRLMVLMSHNTDIADGWEREGEDWDFFHRYSPLGYAVGINVAIWSMTH